MVFQIQNLEDFRKAIKTTLDNTNTVSREVLQNSIHAFLDQSGLINESLDVLKEELQCSVCRTTLLQACSTKCHHVFCSYCLDMCLLQNKRHCPMCRTSISDLVTKTRLYGTDLIVETVMLKHDPKYKFWVKQENFERFCQFCTTSLQSSYNVIVRCLEKYKSSHNDEKIIEEVGNLSQKFLSLLKEVPCSEADMDSFLKKKKELYELSKCILEPLVSLGYLKCFFD